GDFGVVDEKASLQLKEGGEVEFDAFDIDRDEAKKKGKDEELGDGRFGLGDHVEGKAEPAAVELLAAGLELAPAESAEGYDFRGGLSKGLMGGRMERFGRS